MMFLQKGIKGTKDCASGQEASRSEYLPVRFAFVKEMVFFIMASAMSKPIHMYSKPGKIAIGKVARFANSEAVTQSGSPNRRFSSIIGSNGERTLQKYFRRDASGC